MTQRIPVPEAARTHAVPEHVIYAAVRDGEVEGHRAPRWRRLFLFDFETYVDDDDRLGAVVAEWERLQQAAAEAVALVNPLPIVEWAAEIVAEVQRKAQEERGAVPPPAETEWLTTSEVAERSGASERTVARWASDGEVAAKKEYPNRPSCKVWLIADDAVLAERINAYHAYTQTAAYQNQHGFDWLTYPEAEKKYGPNTSTLSRWNREGRLTAKFGDPWPGNRRPRVLIADDERLAECVKRWEEDPRSTRNVAEPTPETATTSELAQRYPSIGQTAFSTLSRIGALVAEKDDRGWWKIVVDHEMLGKLAERYAATKASPHNEATYEQKKALDSLGYEVWGEWLSRKDASVLIGILRDHQGPSASGDGQSSAPPVLVVPHSGDEITPEEAKKRAEMHRARAAEYEALVTEAA